MLRPLNYLLVNGRRVALAARAVLLVQGAEVGVARDARHGVGGVAGVVLVPELPKQLSWPLLGCLKALTSAQRASRDLEDPSKSIKIPFKTM